MIVVKKKQKSNLNVKLLEIINLFNSSYLFCNDTIK